MNQPSAVTVTVTPADTGKRIAAALIDLVLMVVLMVVVGLVFGGTEGGSEDGSTSFSVNLSGTGAVVFIVLSFGYYWLLEATTGQTLGKMALGLRVTGPSGELIGLTKSLIRNLVRIVDFLPFLYLVGFICVVNSKQKQRLGDMAAGSFVISAR